jgi:molybdopterin/thiamine biosynthesis adenylyltransferase/rhodanese-related sulfurtransferase
VEINYATPAQLNNKPTMNSGKIDFSKEELSLYNRQIILPGFGLESQQKLNAAKVLVIGAGGLGCPALLYLAAAGVGTIGIVDFDTVDRSNLHRQVLFGREDIGTAKVEAAKKRLEKLNPLTRLVTYHTRISAQNAIDIIREYDIVADGTDNFPTRYLVNDACVLLKKPFVYASVFQFEGQVTVFNLTDKNGNTGPNYRDLYPSPPSPGQVPGCEEAGVLGVLPGILGNLQALEVIKVITGLGEVISGQLFVFNALSFETNSFHIKRREDNPINGKNITIHALIDYEQFCGKNENIETRVKEIAPKELYDWQMGNEKIQLIDVREVYEYQIVNIGSELIPLGTLKENISKINPHVKTVVLCKTGDRSIKAIRELEENFGFKNLYNLRGGILAYIEQIRPELTKY